MPRTIYQDRFANLLKGELSSTFKKAGFQRKGNNFFRECPDVWQVVNFQNSHWNTAIWGQCFINVGIDFKSPEKTPRSQFPRECECEIRERMGPFLGYDRDFVLEISQEEHVAILRECLIVIFQAKLFPFLNMFTSEEQIIKSLREDVCYYNEIYAGRDFFRRMVQVCKKHNETELGLRLVEDRQALVDLNDDPSDTVKEYRIWLESQKMDLLSANNVPDVPISGEGKAGDKVTARYCTADPKAEIIDLVDRMTVVENYTNSADSVAWWAYRDAETLADAGYIPVLKELIPAEPKKKRRDALYFILGKLGNRLGLAETASILIERLSIETDEDVLRFMLEKIAAIPKDSSVNMDAVIRLTDDKRERVRGSAIAALNKAADPVVEDKLIEICGSERNYSDMARSNGCLNEIGTSRAIPVLETHLKSRSRTVKRSAECAIDAIRKRQKDGKY
jgi:hypothetical protein